MVSLLGPQWLCDCNASGGAETLTQAADGAASHFLSHGDAGTFPYVVAVYRKRGDWAYSITTGPEADKARKAAMPPPSYTTTLTTSSPLPPGRAVLVDTGDRVQIFNTPVYDAGLTFAEAQKEMLARFDQAMQPMVDWTRSRRAA